MELVEHIPLALSKKQKGPHVLEITALWPRRTPSCAWTASRAPSARRIAKPNPRAPSARRDIQTGCAGPTFTVGPWEAIWFWCCCFMVLPFCVCFYSVRFRSSVMSARFRGKKDQRTADFFRLRVSGRVARSRLGWGNLPSPKVTDNHTSIDDLVRSAGGHDGGEKPGAGVRS